MRSSKAIWLARGVALLFIAFCFGQAFRAGRADGVRSEPGAAQASQPATAKLQLVSTPAAERRQLRTVPIRDLHPGMRVLAENPELTGDRLPDAEVTAADWRLVQLQMQKPDGGLLDIELLRPVEWLLAETLLRIESEDDLSQLLPRPLTVAVADAPLADVLLGRTIELDLPELGAQGPATVRAIRPCPEVETANHAGRRLITGTFHHSAGNVLKLEIEDAAGPIGVTSNHPFWSADRQAFVEAGQLQVGEQLQQADGTLVQVTRITPHTGPPVEVYNLEVDAEHVYHVGAGGVLVHNTYPLLQDMHHGTPTAVINKLRTQFGLIRSKLQGVAGRPNRVGVPSNLHQAGHNGHLPGLDRYNIEFMRRVDALNAFKRSKNFFLSEEDIWNIRAGMIWEYFGVLPN